MTEREVTSITMTNEASQRALSYERVNIECGCGYVVGNLGELAAWKTYASHLEAHIAGVRSEVTGERRKTIPGKVLSDD